MGTINGYPLEESPAATDRLLIESADGTDTRSVEWSTLPSGGSADFTDAGWFLVNAAFDGTTDVTAAVQAAIDAAAVNGGTVVLPAGTGRISGRLVVDDNVTIRGQGKDSTVLQTTATTGALPDGSMIYAADRLRNVRLQGFTLKGHGETQTSGTGVLFESSSGAAWTHCEISDMHIEDFPEYGIYWEVPIISTIDRVYVKNCGIDGIYADEGTSLDVRGAYVTGCNRAGIHFKTMTYSTLSICAPEYCTIGYWLETSRQIALNGCGGEVAINADSGATGYVAHYRIQSCEGIVVNGAYSIRFAYLSESPAYHWHITGSKGVILNGIRTVDTNEPGGIEPYEPATYDVNIDASSTVSMDKPLFNAGSGMSGVVPGVNGVAQVWIDRDTGAPRQRSQTITGTSDTLAAVDHGAVNTYTNDSLVTVTLPSGTSLPVGFDCLLAADGDAGITLSTSGLTIVGSANDACAKGEAMYVCKTGTDTWLVLGATTS